MRKLAPGGGEEEKECCYMTSYCHFDFRCPFSLYDLQYKGFWLECLGPFWNRALGGGE